MTTTTTIEAIFIGTGPDLDPFEGDFVSEDAGTLIGQTFGSAGAPLWQSIVALDLNDTDNSGSIDSNDFGGPAETIGSGGTVAQLDSVIDVDVTLTYTDGTTATTTMLLLQDAIGRMFLAPMLTGNAANAVLDDKPIESIRIDAVPVDDYNGVWTGLEPDAFIACFAAGTRIETPHGPRDVDRLMAGDLLMTVDHGAQPILWIGATRAAARGCGAIVRIARGALGWEQPARGLKVSLQHRVMLPAGRDGDEVLLRALALTTLPGVSRIEDGRDVTYVHFLLPRHSLVLSEGLATESLLPGPWTMERFTPAQRAEVAQLCGDPEAYAAAPVRPILTGRAERDAVRALRAMLKRSA
ncbi:MAG: Hint domain [Rhodobacteraceae bacterium HLUCCA08]|nr:MAG: Hint domain [Rhodobacteraceae bacterium HLUCCA08]